MKRALSLFIAVVMVVSMIAVGMPVSAATLDENNVGIEVPYFSGIAYFNESTGRLGKQEYTFDEPAQISGLENESVVKDGDSELVLDGVVTEEEWGTPILDLSSDYAAVTGGLSVSGENSYYWHTENGTNQFSDAFGLNYKLWMAWDEEYLYVAARVDDPDGQLLAAGGVDVWNGDCLQIRVDPDGPNSKVGGTGYDASVDPWPWATTERSGYGESYGGNVMNLGIGYLSGGEIEIFDMSPRYAPYMGDALDPDTAEPIKVLMWNQNPTYYFQNYIDAPGYDPAEPTLERNPFGNTFGTAILTMNSTEANRKAIDTQIEVAIPWTYMNGSSVTYTEIVDETTGEISIEYAANILEDLPEVGDEYGLAIALLNGGRGGNGYNSWLTWGSGICAGQFEKDYMTAGGSNSMVLVADELGTTGCVHTYAAATCEAPETCTLCGYERGFATGHAYTHELVAAPTSTTDGLIISTCTAGCNGVVETVIPAGKTDPNYAFEGTVANSIWSDGFNYLYYDDEEMTIPTIDPTTNMQKDALETDENGDVYFDFTTTDTGTYYATNKNFYELGYSIDIALTGEDITEYDVEDDGTVTTEEANGNYVDGIYYNFGGITYFPSGKTYGINYIAGFFPSAPGSTSGKFAMYKNANSGLVVDPIEGACELMYETEEIDLGTDWHNFVLSYDKDAKTAIFYLDGEALFGVWDEDLSMENNDQIAIIRNFEVACKIKNMQIGDSDAFNAIGEDVGPTTYTLTIDGVEYGQYEEGETVELPVPALTISGNIAKRFFTYTGAEVTRSAFSTRTATANGRTYTLVMPAADVELTSQFVIVGNVYDKDQRITTRDAQALKKLIGAAGTFTAQQTEAADIILDGRINTRDTMAYKKLVLGLQLPTK